MTLELVAIVITAITAAAVVAAIVQAYIGFREMQRMTRAVAGLVVQESAKIRELMRD